MVEPYAGGIKQTRSGPARVELRNAVRYVVRAIGHGKSIQHLLQRCRCARSEGSIWNKGDVRCLRLIEAQALIRNEEERPVLPAIKSGNFNRPAKRSAKV